MYQFRLSRLSLSGLTRQSLKEDPRGELCCAPGMMMRGWFGHHPEFRHVVPEDDDEWRMFSFAIF